MFTPVLTGHQRARLSQSLNFFRQRLCVYLFKLIFDFLVALFKLFVLLLKIADGLGAGFYSFTHANSLVQVCLLLLSSIFCLLEGVGVFTFSLLLFVF